MTCRACSAQITVDRPVPLPRSTTRIGCGVCTSCVQISRRMVGGAGRASAYNSASPHQILMVSVVAVSFLFLYDCFWFDCVIVPRIGLIVYTRALMDQHSPSITLPIPCSCQNRFRIAISRTEYNNSMIEKLISYTAIEHRTLASTSHFNQPTFLFF